MTISKRQLDQKIMRVCISYTHPYPIKFLNHTYLLEYACCVFKLICRLQAHFGLTQNHRKYQSSDSGSNGPSEAQELKQTQLGQAVPQLLDNGRPRQAHSRKLGAVGGPDRPTE